MEHLKKLLMSFVYGFRGIFRSIKSERNLRIHMVGATYMISILTLTDWFILGRIEWAILLLCCGFVIGSEIMNTGIEDAVNHASKEYTEYGKRSKDAAAGAVIVSVITAIVVGFIILFQPKALKTMFEYFVANPAMFVLLVLSFIPATILIFFGLPKEKGKK